MIYHEGNKALSARYKMVNIRQWRVVTEVYRGARLVWTAIKSCFGAGYWVNDKPWLNNEGWKN
jgi:hypothetical protein